MGTSTAGYCCRCCWRSRASATCRLDRRVRRSGGSAAILPSSPATAAPSRKCSPSSTTSRSSTGLAAAKSYQLAYGDWKLGATAGRSAGRARPSRHRKSSASKAAKSCVQHARDAIAKDPRMAEIYAIEAACDTYQPGSLKQGSTACMRSKSMRTALTLGARESTRAVHQCVVLARC